jgi:bacillithiol biosynthesis cysteine-adding enzyme BshC
METAAAVARAKRAVAPEVARALVEQNARLAPSPARDANLDALRTGAAAVVTGQQVGLFLGPLYTLYKAASAIVVARALARDTRQPVVPVFWLQTEDHDVVEIASAAVPGARVAVPVDADNRIAIAHLALPDAIADALDQLAELLGAGDDAAAHLARLRRHYRPGARWADAFAGVLAELFAPEGLVVIDPRDPALAPLAAPIHARALDDASRIASALAARCTELAAAGKPAPIHVRDGAPLSFFHPDGARGPRVRLEPATGGFAEVGSGRVHAPAELRAALAADPLAFSTSALLRPILQDALLPTAAYVGGPAELAYFAQLPPLYRAFDRVPPLAIPRARFRIVDDRSRKLLARLGLAAADIERPELELLARAPGRDASVIAKRLLDPFYDAHAALAGELGDADPQVVRALAKTRASVERSVGKLASRVERQARYADTARVDAIRKLRAWLAPDGAPQERVLALAGFAARGGDRALVERVLAAVDPHDSSLKELS